MTVIDKEQGLASDVGEYWGPDAENPQRVIIDMSLNDDLTLMEFSFEIDGESVILGVPLDRLKRLIR